MFRLFLRQAGHGRSSDLLPAAISPAVLRQPGPAQEVRIPAVIAKPFEERRIAKIRMTTQIDGEGRALQGSQEVLVVDTEGKVMFTALGGTHSMVRLSVEKPADFDAFLAN